MKARLLASVLISIALSLAANAQDPETTPSVEPEVIATDSVDSVLTDGLETDETPEQMQEPVANPEEEVLAPGVTTTAPTQEELEASEAPVAEEVVKIIDSKKAKVQILDKLNAQVDKVEIEIGKKLKYNEIEIELKRCVHSPDDTKEENIAFMRVWDLAKGDYSNQVFKGWIFSSNPALHSLEHPIYDMVLLKCFD